MHATTSKYGFARRTRAPTFSDEGTEDAMTSQHLLAVVRGVRSAACSTVCAAPSGRHWQTDGAPLSPSHLRDPRDAGRRVGQRHKRLYANPSIRTKARIMQYHKPYGFH